MCERTYTHVVARAIEYVGLIEIMLPATLRGLRVITVICIFCIFVCIFVIFYQ